MPTCAIVEHTLSLCHTNRWRKFSIVLPILGCSILSCADIKGTLTTKEHSCHVYSDSMPSKQIIGRIITYSRTTSDFEMESWQHTTLWMTPHISYASTHECLRWSITQSFLLPQICIALEAVLLKLHIKLAPEWALTRSYWNAKLTHLYMYMYMCTKHTCTLSQLSHDSHFPLQWLSHDRHMTVT